MKYGKTACLHAWQGDEMPTVAVCMTGMQRGLIIAFRRKEAQTWLELLDCWLVPHY
jgi:hypothetical protein